MFSKNKSRTWVITDGPTQGRTCRPLKTLDFRSLRHAKCDTLSDETDFDLRCNA